MTAAASLIGILTFNTYRRLLMFRGYCLQTLEAMGIEREHQIWASYGMVFVMHCILATPKCTLLTYLMERGEICKGLTD